MSEGLFFPTLISALAACFYCYQRGFEKGKSEWTEQAIRNLIRDELKIEKNDNT